MPDKGFDSAAPEAPRDGAYVTAVGYTENENQGVVVALRPCQTCYAAVEEAHMAEHEGWHEGQAGAEPKSSSKGSSSSSKSDKD
jgi:hypothetical protein